MEIKTNYLRCRRLHVVLLVRQWGIICQLLDCIITQTDVAMLADRFTKRCNRNRKCRSVSAHVGLVIRRIAVTVDKWRASVCESRMRVRPWINRKWRGHVTYAMTVWETDVWHGGNMLMIRLVMPVTRVSRNLTIIPHAVWYGSLWICAVLMIPGRSEWPEWRQLGPGIVTAGNCGRLERSGGPIRTKLLIWRAIITPPDRSR